MTLEQSARPTFAGHQTFHPRFGWIKKAYDAASDDPDIFNKANAPVLLGVGKNMVEAIRFWGTATRVIAREKNPARPRTTLAHPTQIGAALLDEKKGLDPYLEDPSSLWILHWLALAPPTILPIWWSSFNDFSALEFSEDELKGFCIDEVESTTWPKPNKSSIAKDVDCLLRMYTSRRAQGRQSIDDLIDSPFRTLGLIEPSLSTNRSYRFIRGAKADLSPAAIVFACLDYMALTDPHSRTVSLPRLTADPGSPGRLFKITESVILDAVEQTAKKVADIKVARPAGTTQMMLEADASIVALSVLWQHHNRRRPGLSVPDSEVAGPAARLPVGRQVEIFTGDATDSAVGQAAEQKESAQ